MNNIRISNSAGFTLETLNVETNTQKAAEVASKLYGYVEKSKPYVTVYLFCHDHNIVAIDHDDLYYYILVTYVNNCKFVTKKAKISMQETFYVLKTLQEYCNLALPTQQN